MNIVDVLRSGHTFEVNDVAFATQYITDTGAQSYRVFMVSHAGESDRVHFRPADALQDYLHNIRELLYAIPQPYRLPGEPP